MQKAKLWSKNFILIIMINFLVFTNHFMIMSTFPFYIESLGGTEAAAGAAVLLFSIVAVMCRPLVGWLLDNGLRKTILIVGIIGMALMPLGYMAISVLFMTFMFRLLHGASLSCSSTASATIATDLIPPARFAEGMGAFGMAVALATSFAPALGLAIMDAIGYKALFAAASLVMAAALVLFLLMKTPAVKAEKKPLNLRALIDAKALPASVTMLTFLITFGSIENFIAKYAAAAGLPGGGIYFAIMSCMLLLTRLVTGRLADTRGGGLFVYTCNFSMFAAAMLLALVPTTTTYVLSALLVGYGFGGIQPVLQTMAVRTAHPERRGAANSTFLCAYDIGIGLGGGIAGFLITSLSYGAMFAILAIANILSALIYFVWKNKRTS